MTVILADEKNESKHEAVIYDCNIDIILRICLFMCMWVSVYAHVQICAHVHRSQRISSIVITYMPSTLVVVCMCCGCMCMYVNWSVHLWICVYRPEDVFCIINFLLHPLDTQFFAELGTHHFCLSCLVSDPQWSSEIYLSVSLSARVRSACGNTGFLCTYWGTYRFVRGWLVPKMYKIFWICWN